MYRKISHGVICLSNQLCWGVLPERVSIFQNGKGVVIVPYREGDERKRNRKIKHFDKRGRLIIPLKMLRRVGIADTAEVVRRSDGAIMLLPPAEESKT